ncbi:hypothetical protein Tco_0959920 [Tanacetum coccineum]
MKDRRRFLKKLGLDLSLPLPEQDPSLPKKKRKTMELEPETYIIGLHCNKKLPEGVPFKKNLAIKEPEHGLFFIDAFGEPAFQMIIGIHKVETKTLLGYKVITSNVTSIANQRFSVLMSKMIDERPDKKKIMTKRVKLKI